MPIPYKISSTLEIPGGPTLPNQPIPASNSGNFDHQAEARLVLSGSGTKVVDLGTIASPGIKAFMLQMEADAAAQAVTIRINGSATGGIEVSPGGFLVFGNPTPSAGVTQISVVYTSSAVVRIWALA